MDEDGQRDREHDREHQDEQDDRHDLQSAPVAHERAILQAHGETTRVTTMPAAPVWPTMRTVRSQQPASGTMTIEGQ